MEFVISLIVLVVFAVLMIRNALKTSRGNRRARPEPEWAALVGDSTIAHHVSHSHHVHHHDAVFDVGHHH